jgi:uncharacterized protein (UPF0333 family)
MRNSLLVGSIILAMAATATPALAKTTNVAAAKKLCVAQAKAQPGVKLAKASDTGSQATSTTFIFQLRVTNQDGVQTVSTCTVDRTSGSVSSLLAAAQ